MVKQNLRIIDIVQEAKTVWSYHLETPADAFWEEGAHVHIAHVGYDAGETPDKAWVRHLSVATLPGEGYIGFTTRIPEHASVFKRKLSGLRVGDELVVFKLGSRMQLRRVSRPIVLLSMGVGLATMRPLIFRYLQNREGIPSLTAVNVHAEGETLYADEPWRVGDETCRLLWATSRLAYHETLLTLVEHQESLFYVVGSDRFLHDSIGALRRSGVADKDIFLDKKEEVLADFFTGI